jgi:hypothetical protein
MRVGWLDMSRGDDTVPLVDKGALLVIKREFFA